VHGQDRDAGPVVDPAELAPYVEGGRAIRRSRRVRLGDVTASGRVRLDALARYLQDVAADDVDDAALPAGAGWVLRRIDLDIVRLPALGEHLGLETRATGVGPGARWAERTTTVADERGAVIVTSRAVWVYVDLTSLSPRALPPEFFDVYGDEVRTRRVTARLTLPRPGAAAPRESWPLRATDVDVYGHVNNAAYWEAVEEWLGGPGLGRSIAAATIEFGSGLDTRDRCELAILDAGTDVTCWFLVADETRAAARVVFDPVEADR
jgi:acyl-ACP thioesterase